MPGPVISSGSITVESLSTPVVAIDYINVEERSHGIKRGGVYVDDIFYPAVILTDGSGSLATQTAGDINNHQVMVQVALGQANIFLYDTERQTLYNQNGYILTGEE